MAVAVSKTDSKLFRKCCNSFDVQFNRRDALDKSILFDFSSCDALSKERKILSQNTINTTNSKDSIFFRNPEAMHFSIGLSLVRDSCAKLLIYEHIYHEEPSLH